MVMLLWGNKFATLKLRVASKWASENLWWYYLVKSIISYLYYHVFNKKSYYSLFKRLLFSMNDFSFIRAVLLYTLINALFYTKIVPIFEYIQAPVMHKLSYEHK